MKKLLDSQVEALKEAGWSFGEHDGVDFAKNGQDEIYGEKVFSFLEEEAEELLIGSYNSIKKLEDLLLLDGYKLILQN